MILREPITTTLCIIPKYMLYMIKCGPKRFWGNQPVKGVFLNLVKVVKFHKKVTCKSNMLKIGDVLNLYTKISGVGWKSCYILTSDKADKCPLQSWRFVVRFGMPAHITFNPRPNRYSVLELYSVIQYARLSAVPVGGGVNPLTFLHLSKLCL